MAFLWGLIWAWSLVAGLWHFWMGLLFLMAVSVLHFLYAPPSLPALILLMTGTALALALKAVSSRLSPKGADSPAWVLAAGLAALLVGGSLVGPRWGLGLAAHVSSRAFRYFNSQGGKERYWRSLAAWLLPRLGLIWIWLVLGSEIIRSYR